MIGVGIVTCGRPDFYAQVRASVSAGFDELFVYEDGSSEFGYTGTGDGTCLGVGAAKNILFRQMLDAWLQAVLGGLPLHIHSGVLEHIRDTATISPSHGCI